MPLFAFPSHRTLITFSGQISGAKGYGSAVPVNEKAASAQALDIKRIGVLKGHCRDGKSVRFDSANELFQIVIVIGTATLLPAVCGCAFPPARNEASAPKVGSAVILTT